MPRIEPPVAVTMGDPTGIGPEIIVKTFADREFSTPAIVVGDTTILALASELLGCPLGIRPIDRPCDAQPGRDSRAVDLS